MTGDLPRVWVDTDVALGAAARDVDDAFALAALFGAARAGRIELLGITTVTGNATARRSEESARVLAAAADIGVSIIPGRDAPAGAAAGQAIARIPEGTRIVALGPLSNVAAALELAPELASRVSLRVVGGNLSSSGIFPPLWPHEFNLARDRPSARAALRAPWREMVFYPLDVVRRLRCDRARLDEVGRLGAVGALLARESRRWLARARWRHGKKGFPIWDLPPALQAAGALEVLAAPRTFSRAQRAFSGIPEQTLAATSFDAGEAWRAFMELMQVFAAGGRA